MTTPAQVFDYDMETRTRTLRKTQEVPSGHNPADYVTRRLLGARPPTARWCRSRCSTEGHAARRLGAAVPLRLRRLRHHHPGRLLDQRGCRWSTAASSSPSPTSAAARTRAIAGTPTASSRRSSTPSPTSSPPASILVQRGLHPPRPHRRQRRLGRRHADGRGRQHGAGPVPRHHRRRAVRRRAQHHARRDACR